MLLQRAMWVFLIRLLLVLRCGLRSRARLQAEIVLLRQQVLVLSRRAPARMRLRNLDRALLVWLYRFFPSLLKKITLVKPEIAASHEGPWLPAHSSNVPRFKGLRERFRSLPCRPVTPTITSNPCHPEPTATSLIRSAPVPRPLSRSRSARVAAGTRPRARASNAATWAVPKT